MDFAANCILVRPSWSHIPRQQVKLLLRVYQMAHRNRSARLGCVETVSKPPGFGAIGLQLSEKQIPQVIGFIRKWSKQRELLEWAALRPRQVRCQAALRPTRNSSYSKLV